MDAAYLQRDASSPAADATDATLLRGVHQGRQDAATLLYFRYAEQLRGVADRKLARDLAARVSADDIVQSVFRTFFRRASLGQFEVPSGEDLWKLFLVIALNKICNVAAYHRAARRDVQRTVAPPSDLPLAAAAQGDESSLTILRLVIEELLAGMTPSQRQIVELRIEGRDIAEIATAVGRSKRSVERILQTFREQLKAALVDEVPDAAAPSSHSSGPAGWADRRV